MVDFAEDWWKLKFLFRFGQDIYKIEAERKRKFCFVGIRKWTEDFTEMKIENYRM